MENEKKPMLKSACFSLIFLLCSSFLFAQEGSLISSHGTFGIKEYTFELEKMQDPILLQDDHILIANDNHVVYCLKPDGLSRDSAFGTHGMVSINGIINDGENYFIQGMGQFSDGKLLIFAYAPVNSARKYVLVMIGRNGQPVAGPWPGASLVLDDPIFDDIGLYHMMEVLPILVSNIRRGLILPDGSFIVAGKDAGDGFVAKFLPNGMYDRDFANQGQYYDGVYSRIIYLQSQSDGKTLLWGEDASSDNPVLSRITPDGQKDTSFGTNGSTEVSISLFSLVNTGLLRRADGNILGFAYYINKDKNFSLLFQGSGLGTGVFALDKGAFRAFPNPCRETFTIDFPEDVEMEISTLSGQKVLSGRWPAGQHEIHMGDFPGGVYFVRAHGKRNYVLKIVRE